MALLNHVLNFAAPAAAVALLLGVAVPIFWRKEPARLAWWAQTAIVFAVGCATLLGTLWLLGRDGRMAGYAALVLATASMQWGLLGGWKH